MNGMEMLLQSFGVNTDEVKENVQSAVELVKEMNLRIGAVETGQRQILAQLNLLNETLRGRDAEQWPPPVTQSFEDLEGRRRSLENAGRTEGTNAAASRKQASGAAARDS